MNTQTAVFVTDWYLSSSLNLEGILGAGGEKGEELKERNIFFLVETRCAPRLQKTQAVLPHRIF